MAVRGRESIDLAESIETMRFTTNIRLKCILEANEQSFRHLNRTKMDESNPLIEIAYLLSYFASYLEIVMDISVNSTLTLVLN